jgi:hypothetical protein
MYLSSFRVVDVSYVFDYSVSRDVNQLLKLLSSHRSDIINGLIEYVGFIIILLA